MKQMWYVLVFNIIFYNILFSVLNKNVYNSEKNNIEIIRDKNYYKYNNFKYIF